MPEAERAYPIRRFCERLGVSDPRVGVRRAVAQLIRSVPNSDLIPVEIDALCRAARIDVADVPAATSGGGGSFEDLSSRHASLAAMGRGFRLASSGYRYQAGWRAALAHEIGHTFFFERVGGQPVRPLGLGADEEEEELCEFAGRELLLPEQAFRAMATEPRHTGCAAMAVNQLARNCVVSPYLVAMRLLCDLPDLGALLRIRFVALLVRPGGPSKLSAHAKVKWVVDASGRVESQARIRSVARLAESSDRHTDTPAVESAVSTHTYPLGQQSATILVARYPARKGARVVVSRTRARDTSEARNPSDRSARQPPARHDQEEP